MFRIWKSKADVQEKRGVITMENEERGDNAMNGVEVKTEAESDAVMDTSTEVTTEADAEAVPETETDTFPEADAEAETEAEPEADAEPLTGQEDEPDPVMAGMMKAAKKSAQKSAKIAGLDEMIKVVRLLKESNISVPVMIGGATTSPLHTALKIAPQYDGSVIWVKDASQNAPLAAKFINPVTREEAKDTLQKEQQLLCEQDAPTEILSFEEAKKRKLDLF